VTPATVKFTNNLRKGDFDLLVKIPTKAENKVRLVFGLVFYEGFRKAILFEIRLFPGETNA